MTPKEKAEELVDKFSEYANDCYSDFASQDDLIHNIKINAKDCALIAVDEIISNWRAEATIQYPYGKVINYWNVVKEEIIKL